ncbi:SRPBCC domain-containing protein [Sphingomonas hengshuiensis]|uniref:ATPase n=1 Tax=Sphingomonas hengshuiensis TaxID=1609977 RepID=A0A7U5BEF6_9SPHN|nr:SRPBCC domain-containing protein [Sphingomonas hengshuiensis]AJP70734.1 ATPase [Sphingomonas hengshuiensis]
MPDTDPALELSIETLIDAPVDAVWRAWTDHLAEWWCPKPWTTELIEHDVRPGGRSAMILRGPDGEEKNRLEGVILEAIPARRVVWTDAFAVGWVPQEPFLVGVWELEPDGERTRYRASARHWSEDLRDQHAVMGFEAGWLTAARQLEAVAQRIARG